MLESRRTNLTVDQFKSLFLQDVALMDVRAPIEFAAGAIPGASNRPLLNDQQRHLVGTEYADNGQPAAIQLGLKLATPEIRTQRLAAWQAFVKKNPQGYLYCFRGGLRSRTSQQWLADAGIHYPLIEGGYKALRRYLLEQLDRLCEKGNIILLSGKTGVGKTELIQAHPSALDLEGRARHRGSAFGKIFEPQPTQIDWENQIIVDWLRCEARNDSPILIEAESSLIGKIYVPKILQEAMSRAPVLLLKTSTADRVDRLYKDYVEHGLAHYSEITNDPFTALKKDVLENLYRIKKRLGGFKFKRISAQLEDANRSLRDLHDTSGYRMLIKMLLNDYYDHQYQHHHDRNKPNVVAHGSRADICDWLERKPQRIQI